MTRINRAAWRRIKARAADPKAITVWKGATMGATTSLHEFWSAQYQAFALELSVLCGEDFRERKIIEMCKCVAQTSPVWGLHEMWERALGALRRGWSGATESELIMFERRERFPQLFA